MSHDSRHAALPPLDDERVWDALLDSTRDPAGAEPPAWLESAVLREVATRPAPAAVVHSPRAAGFVPAIRRALGWCVAPLTLRVPPLALAGVAAALAVAVLHGSGTGAPTVTPAPADLATESGVAVAQVYVRFVLQAPHARTVSVAGDFNGWRTDDVLLTDEDGDGLWTGLVPVTAGLHKYMFVLDGADWVEDPFAESYVDDGFGRQNAVLTVAPAARAQS